MPPASADGVLVATVWDEKGTPLAERLIYRQPAKELKVSVLADQSTYVPADKVSLKITTTDERGNPVGGVVGVLPDPVPDVPVVAAGVVLAGGALGELTLPTVLVVAVLFAFAVKYIADSGGGQVYDSGKVTAPSVADANSIWQPVSSSSGTCHAQPRSRSA